ncbi:ARF GAP-like zinc finger-containing protein [Trichomonas vaginalis G3]|uniref:ARF GAP-like zinc finger-containing protein n=1 Tax=Trichomonas vaginalis (strain ATCC PRA-98 / G3) TaxID=412133 RepID=A2DSW3_TRIV3|nr:GTPase activator protein [Trichomonas vaginalis G3]EAY16512.1 ARF GAP-like zinc finger-containing protein [Trichomonas vaginalis G3]KAI5488037.1 GTPase activator protein [Trichomonas vaginalis G3]|eukprot:XP_001328735.1 ARF GAP-like zinc finger-containing protein [Trichomonas vaginalis G3]
MSEALRSIQLLLRDPDNRICADCKAKQSEWASTGLGVFICIDCSGVHRSLGTHITLVRSCTLDSWSMNSVRRMQAIGNKIANQYWEANLTDDVKPPGAGNISEITRYIKLKYITKKWAAEGLSPNQIIDNANQPQPKQQHFNVNKHHHKQEKKQQTLAERIKSMKNKNQTQISHKVHPLEKFTPKQERDPFDDEGPFSAQEESQTIQKTNVANTVSEKTEENTFEINNNQDNKPKSRDFSQINQNLNQLSNLTPTETVQSEKESTEIHTTDNSPKNEKEEIDPFDDDDFFSEPKPKSAAAKMIMMGQNPALIQRNKSTTTILKKEIQQKSESLPPQRPMSAQQRLENFFNEETERSPIAQKPNIIRSGNRFKKAKAEESKNKPSYRIQQKIERRKRQVGLQKQNLEDDDDSSHEQLI